MVDKKKKKNKRWVKSVVTSMIGYHTNSKDDKWTYGHEVCLWIRY